jgi:hypothetical protein
MDWKGSKRIGREVLLACAGVLVCSANAWAMSASGPQIGDIAPTRPYPVHLPSVDPPVPLGEPPVDASGVGQSSIDEYSTDDPSADPPSDFDVLPDVPDIPFDYFWTQRDSVDRRARSHAVSNLGLKSTAGRRGLTPRKRILPAMSSDPWTLGSRTWRYSDSDGLDLTLGNEEIEVPVWGRSVRLGGVSLSQSSLVESDYADSWKYSLSLGALDRTTAEQGDLDYGETAGNLVVRYGLNKDLSIESQTQLAPDMAAHGVGGRYQTDWGAWTAGVDRATYGLYKGWRYQAAYSVNIMDDLELSWRNERYTPGFVDLSRYGATDLSQGGTIQSLTAKLPLGRWGDLSGSFENESSTSGDVKRRFGLTQQFWYSPNLRIGLRAQREVVGGDYDIGGRCSFPIY